MPDMRVTHRKTCGQCTNTGLLSPKAQKNIFSSFSSGKTTYTGNNTSVVWNLRSGGGEHVEPTELELATLKS